MKINDLFPGLEKNHQFGSDFSVSIALNPMTITVKVSLSQTTYIGDAAKEIIEHVSSRCFSGMSPRQAIEEWLVENGFLEKDEE